MKDYNTQPSFFRVCIWADLHYNLVSRSSKHFGWMKALTWKEASFLLFFPNKYFHEKIKRQKRKTFKLKDKMFQNEDHKKRNNHHFHS